MSLLIRFNYVAISLFYLICNLNFTVINWQQTPFASLLCLLPFWLLADYHQWLLLSPPLFFLLFFSFTSLEHLPETHQDSNSFFRAPLAEF